MTDTQYGYDDVEISWAVPGLPALDLKTGTVEGTPITQARSGPSWSLSADGTGGGIYVKLNNKTGMLTITVTQQSALHQELLRRHAIDELAKNVVGPILLTDNSDGSSCVFSKARIMGMPNLVRGTESQAFAWDFGYVRDLPVPGSGTANAI